ncbi:MSHA biogenesis protein MshJ [Shewanella gaetbuli]|uniref:MSHA biogenesis protein MshJ n=1 Tax=Shewanella gaetbuli TaxID=220752 RepID=A0A9X1ZM84_9GAMM|nr:MSHA biogenesis protein MshJ [Shewanella gaetbuli]MCL1142090.1 MSHA biogenesis protein MshJ [Shewanella gaetbuli]
MKQTWLNLEQKFNQLSQRERGLIAFATLAVIAMLAFVPIDDNWLGLKKVNNQLSSIKNDINIVEQQISLYQQRLAIDPNADYQQRLSLINQQMQQVDAELTAQMVDMVPADYMPTVLAKLLSNDKGIKLVSFNSIAPVALLKVGDDEAHQMNLYSHGIKLTIEGDYFAVVDFVKAIESMPDKLYWKRLDYQVKKHPLAEVELELYTLSINKDFISVAKQD